MSDEFGLRRVLGLRDLVAIEVGTTVGAGVFSLTAFAALRTGPSVPLAYAVAALPILCIMSAVGTLGAVLPTTGGTYRYPSRLLSPLWAALGVWCYALGLVLGAMPLYATECVRYLQAVRPELPLRPTAVGLLTLFFAVNVLGVAAAARVQALMVAVLLGALLLFGLGGLGHVDPARFTPLFAGGAGGFALSVCVLTFALLGANAVIELGSEIRDPARNVPRSLRISIPLVAALYVLVSAVAVGVIDLPAWRAHGAAANLSQPARVFLDGPLFGVFLVGGAVLAFATTLNATFLWATRSLLVVARDGLLPPSLARTGRFGTPVAFLAVLWALSVAAVLVGAALETLAAYATIGGLVIFLPTMLAAIRLPGRAPQLYVRVGIDPRRRLLRIAPAVGAGLSGLLILLLLADLGARALPFVPWCLGGAALFLWRRRVVERTTGVTLAETARRDLETMIDAAGGQR